MEQRDENRLSTKGFAWRFCLLLLVGCGGSENGLKATKAEDPLQNEVANPANGLQVNESQSDKIPSDGWIEDDGRTLWASPTNGKPIDPSCVPDGSSLILWLRPARLMATEEGQRVWQSLGPARVRFRKAIEEAAQKPLETVDPFLIGIQAGESYDSVARRLIAEPVSSENFALLQREIEELLATSDEERCVTLIFTPRFLLGDGGSLLQGWSAPLRELLIRQTTESCKAIMLSFDLGTPDTASTEEGLLYWELRLVGDAATPATELTKTFAGQMAVWPEELGSAVKNSVPSDYSKRVLGRIEAMAKIATRHARHGVEGRQAVINGYLPAKAAHNLVIATELLISELATEGKVKAEISPREGLSPAERLESPVTISFQRESLETAVTILSEAIGVPIKITGRDLQLEGITRNQMLALDVSNRPAREALVEILRKANPDPLAVSASDPRQKLVYVTDEQEVRITTRAAALGRGDSIPKLFAPTK